MTNLSTRIQSILETEITDEDEYRRYVREFRRINQEATTIIKFCKSSITRVAGEDKEIRRRMEEHRPNSEIRRTYSYDTPELNTMAMGVHQRNRAKLSPLMTQLYEQRHTNKLRLHEGAFPKVPYNPQPEAQAVS